MSIALLGATGPNGCAWLLGGGSTLETFRGELPCTIEVAAPDGMQGADEFAHGLAVVISDDGEITVNEVALAVGAEVVRSLPTADLTFEVVSIAREGGLITVTYEPRPTLPGITVDGTLVEEYHPQDGSILISADADLSLGDVGGTSAISIACAGTLPRDPP